VTASPAEDRFDYPFAEAAVIDLLHSIGEDPKRDGLRDTPERVARAWREMTKGMLQDPADVLGATFECEYDEMVVVQGIEFASLCEHHVLPFTGTAAIGYVPRGRVVGLSKLARLVDVFAHRLQVQERMTVQIADALATHVDAAGVGVVVKATHSCMAVRGVRRIAPTVTSTLRGCFYEDARCRSEFLALATGE